MQGQDVKPLAGNFGQQGKLYFKNSLKDNFPMAVQATLTSILHARGMIVAEWR